MPDLSLYFLYHIRILRMGLTGDFSGVSYAGKSEGNKNFKGTAFLHELPTAQSALRVQPGHQRRVQLFDFFPERIEKN